MSYFHICGKRPLRGESGVQGSKNSALPILASAILVEGECVITNCPALTDVTATVHILRHLGCRVRREEHTVIIDSTGMSGCEIPYGLMREMRSSVIFLGAILARQGKVKLSAPGGCEIGARPIDLHLDGMRKLGAVVTEGTDIISCAAPDGLSGADITLPFPSVGATENIIIAACTARGETVIRNAAREPEIGDLADFLNACGASVGGAGTDTVYIRGVKKLRGATHSVIPDRIAAATLLCGAAMTGGDVSLSGIIPEHLGSVLKVFESAGCDLTCRNSTVRLSAPARLSAVQTVRTMPYPGFPTDIQAPVTAMLSIANGKSAVIENIFENRFRYVSELRRFGAKINVEGRLADAEGVERLTGASVSAPDLRGGAALVLAGLAAEGETDVYEIRHIDRGYENFELTLHSLSAEIKRMDENDGKTKQTAYTADADEPRR